MKNKFKKIVSVLGSVVMIGSTIGMAFAAGGAFPSPFVQDSNAEYAIVYGANAAASDVTATNALNVYLNKFYNETTTTTSTSTVSSSTITGDFSSSVSVSDDIELGEDNIISSKLKEVIEDNKLSTLLDTNIKWDNGDGTESYDIHEEILLTEEVSGDSKLKLVTNLYHADGKDLDSFVVLQNDESLRYRLVFDDLLLLPESDADELEVTILGKEYAITDFNEDFDEISISLSEEKVVKKGDILNIDDTTLTIGEIFDDTVEINGVLVEEDSAIKKIDGLEVQVISTASHPDSTLSKAVIRVGKDIKREISNGDEYIEDDETWEWDIGKNDEDKQYIGVKYALKSIAYDEDDTEENPLLPGQSYIFPENYAALSFDELGNTTYQDFELFFDDKDLYWDDGEERHNDVNVAILEGEEDDSITLTYDGDEIETDNIYFRYVPNSTNYTSTHVEMYFKDLSGDVDSSHEGRIQYGEEYNFSNSLETYSNIAQLIVGDTELKVGLLLGNETNSVTLTLTNEGGVTEIPLGIDDEEFTHLGVEAEDADSDDIIVDGKSIGTKDYDVMDHYGTIIQNPEGYAEDDRVIFSVPDEQVLATISVKGQGEAITTTKDVNETTTEIVETPTLGGILVKDTEISSVQNKNLIIVGGSCINAEAARLLGGTACGEGFTLKTGIVAGKALVQTFASPYNTSKVAVVVAGYNAADTTRAVNAIINSEINLDFGQRTIV